MEQITEHRIRRIMCCCGNGLGTSLFMQMTMEEALEKLNVSGVEVCFGSLADAMEGQADLFVVSEELERTLAGLPVLGLKDLSACEFRRDTESDTDSLRDLKTDCMERIESRESNQNRFNRVQQIKRNEMSGEACQSDI